jgi:MSHA biogenesis protein MshQ
VETAGMGTGVLNANGWVHIGLTWNFNTLTGTNQDRLRIYINGSAIGSGSSVQSLFTSAGALAVGIDTLTIGDNRSSFVDGSAFNGSTNGTGNSANGVIDEFRLYNLEAGLSQVLTDFTRPIGCSRHYAISHAGSGASPTDGRTCVPNTVTIISHTDTDVPIQTASTINLSTSTGQGTWALTTGLGTFTPGAANSGTATYRFNNESQVVLTLNHTTTALVNINVSDGAFSEKPGAEDADLNIVFCTNPNFNGCEYTSGRCTLGASGYDQLFTKLAGRDFKLDALTISLSNTLETTFNGTVAVDLLANTSPTAVAVGTNCPATQTAVIPLGNITFANGRFPGGGVVVPANAFTSVAPTYSAYRDVRMRFTCNSTNCPPSGATVCSRDAFAVRPADFSMGATTSGSPALSLLNPASVTSGANRVTAGAAFNVTAQALTAASPAANALGYNGTPRIPSSIPAQSVLAVSPVPVTVPDYTDRLKDANVNATALLGSASSSTGQAIGQLYYLDYGGFRVLAGGLQDAAFVDPAIDPPTTDCVANSSTNVDQDADPDRERFGCVVANQSNSALIGRFSPAGFVLNSSSIAAGCPAGGFTYERQPFGVNFTASAMSSGTVIAAAVMPRYSAGTVVVGAENSNDGVTLSPRVALNVSPAPVWTNGVYVANAPAATFSRPNPPDPPDGPFDALDIGVQITDPDGGSLWAARNMLPTNNTVCTPGTATTNGTCTHQKLAGSPARMRYGRLRMLNAYGSELLALPMSLTSEYWATTGWVTNTLDGCTSVPVPTSASGMVFGAGNLSAGETVASINGTTTGNGTLIAGDAGFRLSAPGSGNTGFVTITIATPDWLEFPWVTSGVNADASARATFGLFKSPLIYRRENY